MKITQISAAALLVALLAAAPSSAQPGWGRWGGYGGGWGGGYGGWGGGFGRSSLSNDWGSPRLNRGGPVADSREGKVSSEQFMADDAAALLGKGAVMVTTLAGSTATGSDQATYEAAMIDQLIKAGYDTTNPKPTDGQIVEIRVIRDTLVPEEEKRKPVSGEMSVGVSNYGSMVGMAVAVDLTKPKKALISTRLEAKVKDRATDKVLWEGRADIDTRQDDEHWTEQDIAGRLAAALFEHFPSTTTAAVARR